MSSGPRVVSFFCAAFPLDSFPSLSSSTPIATSPAVSTCADRCGSPVARDSSSTVSGPSFSFSNRPISAPAKSILQPMNRPPSSARKSGSSGWGNAIAGEGMGDPEDGPVAGLTATGRESSRHGHLRISGKPRGGSSGAGDLPVQVIDGLAQRPADRARLRGGEGGGDRAPHLGGDGEDLVRQPPAPGGERVAGAAPVLARALVAHQPARGQRLHHPGGGGH